MAIHTSKIVIIGCGFVGSSIAYAALIRGLCNELVMVDRSRKKAEGEVMDLSHGLPFIPPVEIRAGGYEDCAGAEIIVISAGANQKPGETRLELAQQNANILHKIIDEISKYERNAILLIVTNPVDVLTALVRLHTDLPPQKIIGSGTVLDTARFRYLLSRHCNISPSNIHAYVVGEHGDSEVPLFSSAKIAGSNIKAACTNCPLNCGEDWHEGIIADVKRAAYEIINRKGATYYGIGLSCTQIMQAILRNEQKVYTVSSWLEDQYSELGAAISVPSILGMDGIVRRLDMKMSETEHELFLKSAQTLKESLAQITW